MKFKGLYDFVDALAERYRNTDNVRTQIEILQCLTLYYENALSSRYLTSQRDHVKKTIKALNEPFYQGYFK